MHPLPTSQRLEFRSWKESDLPLAMMLWGDPKVTALIYADPVLSPAQIAERLQFEIALEQKTGVQYWPIFLRETQEFIGCGGLRARETEHTFEMGCHLRPAFWGQGIATEFAQTVIPFAFKSLGASALMAGHHPNNAASRHMLASLGFSFLQEEFYMPTGLWHPFYQLLRD